jgi:putative hydrolase of the HAD superfamily
VKKYKHIYFDLDRTIWDFDGNSYHTLKDILEKFDLSNIDPDDFYKAYSYFNEQHWAMFREGKINKENLRLERFIKTLDKFGISNRELAEKISIEYIRIGPTRTGLVPYAREILEELSANYSLYIITNGFIDIQTNKLKNSSVYSYFKRIFTSEHAQTSKPNRGIFEYALSTVNAKKKESLMIGDDLEVDILGALAYGIDQVFYNPLGLQHNVQVTYEIRSLMELKEIL